MTVEVEGFDEAACEAMWRAYQTDESYEVFREKAQKAIWFWSLIDERPIGAVYFEIDPRLDAPVIHAAVETPGKAAASLERLIEQGIHRWGSLYAPARVSNVRACRLAEKFGFRAIAENGDARLYWRNSWAQ
jgi:hypothetical protein